MLSCLRRGLDLLQQHYGADFSLATLPQDDAAVYDMLSRADSVGVFQVESCAQMSMLPRLKPQCFYDLVIEVAIVLRGRSRAIWCILTCVGATASKRSMIPSPAPAHGPKNELEEVLKRTLGVPLFQEQAMQIAITAAKFTPERGRRRAAPRPWPRSVTTGNVHLFRDKFINGMAGRAAIDRTFAETLLRARSKKRPEYGFPESHAALCAPWFTPRHGSNAVIRTFSAPPFSTASRWVFISRRSSCATRGRTASKSAQSTSTSAPGIARSNQGRTASMRAARLPS